MVDMVEAGACLCMLLWGSVCGGRRMEDELSDTPGTGCLLPLWFLVIHHRHRHQSLHLVRFPSFISYT
jgi:hypothetical protein